MLSTLAQYQTDYNSTQVDDLSDGEAILALVFFLIFALMFIAQAFFFIASLIHIVKNDSKDKTTWLLLVLLLAFPCAMIYYFSQRKKVDAEMAAAKRIK